MAEWRIVPAQEKYCASHLETINGVARERQYLSTNVGFSYEDIIVFYKYCEKENFPQFYVVDENVAAVGWCDIVTRKGFSRRVGFIGVGLRPDYRGMGIGPQLMQRAMDDAFDKCFRVIKLDCRVSNKRAIGVYKKLGFRIVPLKRQVLELDGQRIPLLRMTKRLRGKKEV